MGGYFGSYAISSEAIRNRRSAIRGSLKETSGCLLRATNKSSDQELATIDLSNSIISGGKNLSGSVIFQGWYNNYLAPNKDIPAIFNVSSKLTSIEIIPIRFQVHDNKKRLVSCSKAKIVENLNCGLPVVCEDTCFSLGYECNPQTICGSSVDCGTCTLPEVCEVDTCVAPECTSNDLSNCEAGEVCVSGVCQLCGNGIWVIDNEECDDGNTNDGDGCSSSCEQEAGWDCDGEPSVCS